MTRSLEEELADLIIHNNAGPVSLREVAVAVGGLLVLGVAAAAVAVGVGVGVVNSRMHVDNFLFLTLGGRLSFSFNCFCSELQCPLFKLQLLSTPLINPPVQHCRQTSKQQGCPFPPCRADAPVKMGDTFTLHILFCNVASFKAKLTGRVRS